jgi:hypothetical protein
MSPVRLKVESRDGDFSRDDRVHSRSPVTDHEEEFALGENILQIRSRLERERILVAEARRRLAVTSYHLEEWQISILVKVVDACHRTYLQDEGRNGRFEDFAGDSGLLQP